MIFAGLTFQSFSVNFAPAFKIELETKAWFLTREAIITRQVSTEAGLLSGEPIFGFQID
jgi:hypothetical protein